MRARGLWAIWFVALALIALAAVPVYVGNRVDEAQDEINEILAPASAMSSRLSLLKSRQMARFEGFALTGDRSFRLPYVGAIAEEDTLFARLGVLSSNLDFEVRERLAELSAQTTRWHLENQRIFDERDPAVRVAARARSRTAYDQIQLATQELDRAIQSEVAEGRRRMEQARTLQARLTFALVALALGATLVVGRVGSRLVRLTREAESRRRDAVRARREIDALLEATGDGVLGIDLEGKCIALNRAGVKLLGYPEVDIRGRDVHDTVHHSYPDGTSRPRGESRILAALLKGEAADAIAEDVLWRRDGTSFPAMWSLRPLVDGTEIRGSVLTFTDMTEIHRKEEALRQAIRQREDVVSIVSHDLRNPLGVIFGATDILLELPLTERQRKAQAEIIGRAAQRMGNLIEDLLDVARIEDGVFVVRRALENLGDIVQEAADLFADQAAKKDIALQVEVEHDLLTARVDRDRVLQAMANLLDNAVRLTPEGGCIALRARRIGGRVTVQVRDTGPGIDPEVLGNLFDRYWHKPDGKRRTGGLGLMIVKGVMEGHGGEVTVESQPGRGATFTLSFPAPAGELAREAYG